MLKKIEETRRKAGELSVLQGEKELRYLEKIAQK